MSQASGFSLDLPYPMSEPGRAVLGRFAQRNRDKIAEGDRKAFGNLSAADAMEALSTGSYQGLEGIDFGTSFGRPVAKLPNGAVIQVSAGEMLAAIRKRESTRRQVVSKAVEQINRDEFGAENEDVFESMLMSAVSNDQMSEDTANSYRSFYKMDPMGVLAYLGGVDMADKRQAKEVERRGINERYRMSTAQMVGSVTQFINNTRDRFANQAANQNPEQEARATSISRGIKGFSDTMAAGNAMDRSFTDGNLPTFANNIRAMAIGDIQLGEALTNIRNVLTGDFDPEQLDQKQAMLQANIDLAMERANRYLREAGVPVSQDYLQRVITTAAAEDGALPAEAATLDTIMESNRRRALTLSFEELDRNLKNKPYSGEQEEREAQVARFIEDYTRQAGSPMVVDPISLQETVEEMQRSGADELLDGLASRGLLFKDVRGNYFISPEARMQDEMGRESQSGTQQERNERAGRRGGRFGN